MAERAARWAKKQDLLRLQVGSEQGLLREIQKHEREELLLLSPLLPLCVWPRAENGWDSQVVVLDEAIGHLDLERDRAALARVREMMKKE